MDQAVQHTRRGGVTVLLSGAAVTMGLGLLGSLAAWLLVDDAAGRGALVGTVVVVVIASGGALVVDVVAAVLPGASLLVALLTYALQLLLVVFAFVALERSGLLDSTLDRQWLGVTAITATLLWLVTQVVLTFRARIPVYDLPAVEPLPGCRPGRVDDPEGGEG